MIAFHGRKMQLTMIAALTIFCFATTASAAAPNVTYTAAGTFAVPQSSGSDLFKLAGEPFSISVVGNSAAVPTKHGAKWALFSGLKMTGTANSGLLPTPISISSSQTSILLATGNPSFDTFQLGTTIKVVGIQLTITCKVQMPKGTLSTPLIHPFTAPVTLNASIASVIYSDTTASTTLAISSGTVNAVVGGASAPAASVTQSADVILHSTGAQAVTHHADGTQSVRSAHGASVDLGAPEDTVALQFYATGVRDGSEVRVQIAGQDVPVLYAGKSDHFEGLDQVSVQLPRSLAGIGEAEVVLTVDGQNSSPVRIHIQ